MNLTCIRCTSTYLIVRNAVVEIIHIHPAFQCMSKLLVCPIINTEGQHGRHAVQHLQFKLLSGMIDNLHLAHQSSVTFMRKREILHTHLKTCVWIGAMYFQHVAGYQHFLLFTLHRMHSRKWLHIVPLPLHLHL
ncbi:hypothetical protein D3C74_332340 [compost metagenome]